MLVPVLLKNVLNTLIWHNSITPVTMSTKSESMARSVTTVPNAFGNDTPSYLFSTPQRVNSPIRGTRRLAAYEMNIEYMLTDRLGCSPTGSSVCLHRQPRSICASMPKGNESAIHVQSISWSNTSFMLLKSKPRYIQYNMAPPNASGIIILTQVFAIFLASISICKYTLFRA